MTEEERYARVAEQMKGLLDAAALDMNPAANLLRAQLYAELYARNEATHLRVMVARTDFIETLIARIAQGERP
jgi:hypothetical protein